MSSSRGGVVAAPKWDADQAKVIFDDKASWQLVTAGPGAGKTAVSCKRIAHLIESGVPAARILLVSFTRTAVAELSSRIGAYTTPASAARSVRISTVDSHAWMLRNGFEDELLSRVVGDQSYEISIQRTLDLFRTKSHELLEFMANFEHVLVDEAQDVVGPRAEVVMAMLGSLSRECGVTVLADPAQAIYGFTTDGNDDGRSELPLLDRLCASPPRAMTQRTLKNVHRTRERALLDLLRRARPEVVATDPDPDHVARLQKMIRDTAGNHLGSPSREDLATYLCEGHAESLVLFRRRVDVLLASSYCAGEGIEHRLRMSGLPTVIRPWLGWLLGGTTGTTLSQRDFDELWESCARVCAVPFAGEHRDDCWALLHRLAAGSRRGTIDLVRLREVVARQRPPIEICYRELGAIGPILGTIHASKGREADTVVLVMSPQDDCITLDDAELLEEGRVQYVGATRARHKLITADQSAPFAGYLESGRVFRKVARGSQVKAQLEIGRDGDVDKLVHLAWTNAGRVQRLLAGCANRSRPVELHSTRTHSFVPRVMIGDGDGAGGIAVGELSSSFVADFKRLWARMGRGLKPAEIIRNVHLVAVGTVALTEHERDGVRPPFNQSGFGLAPVLRGLPMIYFWRREGPPR